MRTKTEARREAILAAAKAVFEEVGFEQATMSEITTRVGGSKATLYRYFDSKEALFRELLRRAASEHRSTVFELLHPCSQMTEDGLPPEAADVLALLNPEADVATVLQAFGERVLKTFHTLEKISAWRMVIAAANDPEVGRLFYENGPARGIQYVERYFDSVMKAGNLRKTIPRVAAAHFRALVESEVDEPGLFNARPELKDEEIREIVARAVDVFMRAYGPEA
ncbi:TetR family transcriptional regulator [Pseudomonas sp. PIC25]|uniref:TetR/AcrR family transcriptional regulator n=1 Tax=Pseudomonas sp. PIC25 TaxID=1958773 RepID=UPI000BC6BF0D|nr:TetR/AcrR family transcriptional regulator [Pseudomonas sp. PIC25]PAU60580.1 TetR family transcriptional regulator [Pseudomonas sp. PIC25]